MIDTVPQPSQANRWKDLYVVALLEGEREKIPSVIAEAERAIVDRVRALFQASGDHIQERQDLDDALYALHALKSCLAIHGRFAEVG